MITKLYSIFDTKTGIYNKPFHAHNEADAIRNCTRAINDQEVEAAKTPQDYQLWYLGEFDDTKGEIASQPAIHIVNLIELVNKNA